MLIIRGHKLSLQNALNKFFSALGEVFATPTASAYSHARRKLKPELFAHLNRVACEDFYHLYEADGMVRRWHGQRLLAGDGTYLHVPDTKETRREFSLQVNQHEGGECVQALAFVLYDLGNDLGLAAALGKRQAEKNLLFRPSVWEATREGDVIVLDRAYADYTVFAYLLAEQRDAVVRLPHSRFRVAEPFWHSQKLEAVIRMGAPDSARQFVEAHQLPPEIELRLIRVQLETGEEEVLATTLVDRQRYLREEFQAVYGWRWGEESYFDRFKNIFEVERFSGSSRQAIHQDFQGALFLSSLESILSKGAQAKLAGAASPEAQSRPQVNRAVSYVALLERVIELLLTYREIGEVVAELHHLLEKSPSRERKGRKVDRPKLKYAHRLRYHKYVKKLTA